jgi:molybdopterin-biosynthesis enzyme MoeA-like protein
VTLIRTGSPMRVETIAAGAIPEGRYADALAGLAKAHANVIIGSYPSFADGKFRNQIVVRGKEEADVAEARAAVEAMLAAVGGDSQPA